MSRCVRVVVIAALGAIAVLALGVLCTCSCPARPTDRVDGESEAEGFRFRGLTPEARDALAALVEREQRPIHVVALSGGAQNGAFGAGILCSWPDRPSHVDIWTGISTGSLLLTHGFLLGKELRPHGPESERIRERYRDQLKEAYTTYSEPDLMSMRGKLAMLSHSGMASMDGLRRIVAKYATDAAIDDVAAAVRETDVLTVGTTDMDTGKFIAWDMKALAKARKYDLYRKVIFASCLEPAAMDPEYIAGHMHVDGGVRYQIYAPQIESEIRSLSNTRSMRARGLASRPDERRDGTVPLVRLYLLVNGRLTDQATTTGTCFFDVALRAVDILALESKLGNLLRIQVAMDQLAHDVTGDARSKRFETVLASIDEDFTAQATSHFDKDYMTRLFAYGEARATDGRAWRPYRMSGRELTFVR